jgi:hypothetical protein
VNLLHCGMRQYVTRNFIEATGAVCGSADCFCDRPAGSWRHGCTMALDASFNSYRIA